MDVILIPFLKLTLLLINFLSTALILSVVLNWLFVLGILNFHNTFVHMISEILARLTEPFLRPIRQFLPLVQGVDLSPLILFGILYFLKEVLLQLMVKMALNL